MTPVGNRSSSLRSRRLAPRTGGPLGCSHSTCLGAECSATASCGTDGSAIISAVSLVTADSGAPALLRSSRAASCRASSSKALFSTGVRTGDFVSPAGRNITTFAGVSTGSPGSACGEASSAIGPCR